MFLISIKFQKKFPIKRSSLFLILLPSNRIVNPTVGGSTSQMPNSRGVTRSSLDLECQLGLISVVTE
jgi:hypothetical protein